jgi:DNA-binding response OmpR family regulator
MSGGIPEIDRYPASESKAMGGDRPTILLVEDDEGLRTILARHLRIKGHDVTEAGSAEEAASAIAGGLRPALVILDLNLPGDTGWGLLRSSAMRLAGSPPVVIASAVTVSPKQLAEFGIAGYLPKPFPLDTLLQTVGRVIAGPGPQGPKGADE